MKSFLPKKENKKEILFMQIVYRIVNQYCELTPNNSLNFVLDILTAMERNKLKVK
jgi:hypothetical protein